VGQAPEGKRDGDLVEVAFAGDPVQAEMLQGLLESAGIPSLLQPTGLSGLQLGLGRLYSGFGGGGQRVMVHAARLEQARQLLRDTLVGEDEEAWPWIAEDE
jgi:Putative prokaryotic signal transducing protein